jgi:hypothetical protein
VVGVYDRECLASRRKGWSEWLCSENELGAELDLPCARRALVLTHLLV